MLEKGTQPSPITDLGERFALEPRNREWSNPKWSAWAENSGITLASIDAPELPRTIFHTGRVIYLRMQGRTDWYSHHYTDKESEEEKRNILETNPRKL